MMKQDERWLTKYNEVKSFIETNHRNPSKHRIEEHNMLNWVKQQRDRREPAMWLVFGVNGGRDLSMRFA